MAGRSVRFAVVCPSARPGEHLRVVGAPATLGSWAPERSEVALTTSASDFPLWRSAWVHLAEAESSCEYKYVICGPKGVRWEGTPNRLLKVSASAATVREAFDSKDPAQIEEAEVAEPQGSDLFVRFSLGGKTAKQGQEFRVVGSIGALGEWSPHDSTVVLNEEEAGPGGKARRRTGWIAVPPGLRGFEYKYVLLKPSGSVIWEEGRNRQIPPAELQARTGTWRCTLTDEFGAPGTGCLLEAAAPTSPAPESVASRAVAARPAKPQQAALPAVATAAAQPPSNPQEAPSPPATSPTSTRNALPALPELPEEAQSSLAVLHKKSIPRNPASFCTLMQAIERDNGGPKAAFGLQQMRRANTIGCIEDLPEGLVPTKRSLGLQPANGDLDLVREAACTEYATAEEAILEQSPSFEATTYVSSDSNDASGASRTTDESSVCPPEVEDKAKCESPARFRIGEPEAEPEQPKSFEDGYQLSVKVGEGAFGVVYRCNSRSGGPDLAVKVVNKDRLTHYALQSLLGDEASGKEGEISLHQSLPAHRNVVGIHDCFHEPHCVRLVMDMCRGGDLFDAILRAKQRNKAKCKDAALCETAAGNVVRQILAACEFCHKHGIVHRDVKAENVLLAAPEDEVPLDSNKAVVKLCDFGLSARCWASEGNKMKDPVGSPDYVAPEVARLEAYGQSVDVWSSGVLLFASLRGRMPFPARTDHEALVLVKEGKVTYDKGWERVSPEARDCTQHMLRLTPSERPTAEQAQKHPFFVKGVDIQETAKGG